MVSFKTRLAGRKTRDLELTQNEAETMCSLGFRFAEYAPEAGRFRVSRPYEVIIVSDVDEITIKQQ